MPGPVRTELIEKQLPKLAVQDGTSVDESINHHILGKQWMKRLLEPSEIGKTTDFLASDGTAAITGEGIDVTGDVKCCYIKRKVFLQVDRKPKSKVRS
jgi:3-hydroxybutyrate dehydrogenase